jgi:TatD DNase family protein
MVLIDTHTHLFSDAFDEDREQVVERALENGIKKLLLPNIDETSMPDVLEMTAKHPDSCFAMGGLHPTSVTGEYLKQLDKLFSSFTPKQIVAVGEIGMDLYWDTTFKNQQAEAFKWQVNYAKKNNLPIVIHVREAFEETFKLLEPMLDGELTGVFHSFTGSAEQAQQIINWGFKLGVGGIVTFKNAGVDKVIAQIAPEHLILETDSPYLAPTPKRGKRNESSYLTYIANKVANLHNMQMEEVAHITTQNAKQLFQLPHE